MTPRGAGRPARRPGALAVQPLHVNRDEIFDAVANLLTRQVDTTGFAWGGRLLVWGRSYRAALWAHPNATSIVAAGTGERADFLHMVDHTSMERHGG